MLGVTFSNLLEPASDPRELSIGVGGISLPPSGVSRFAEA